MILNNASLNAALSSSQPLPVGELAQPREALAQNSSFRPVEELSSSSNSRLNSRQTLSNESSLPAESEGQPNSSSEGAVAQENARVDAQREREARIEQAREKQQLLQEQRQITSLSARDREVRSHEQAHAAVGGQYAGAPVYQYERGPDGINYAVSGEVSIDISKEATPQETLRKAQIVRRAALAPAEPSPQDRRVAAQASQMEAQARAEIAQERRTELNDADETSSAEEEKEAPNGLSDDVTAQSNSASLANSPKPQFSAEDLNPSSSPVVNPAGLNTISSNQILAFSDTQANRPGALLSQLV